MPVAVSKVVELSKRVSALDWGDVDAAMELYFQIKAIIKADSRDLRARGLLVTVCQTVGYRDEAVHCLEILDRSWVPDGGALSLNTQGQLIQLGFVERGTDCARQLMEALSTLSPVQKELLTLTALATADRQLIRQLSEKGADGAIRYIKNISILSVEKHLPQLQKVALQIASEYLIGITVGISDDPETGIPCFRATLLIDSSLIHPSDLFDQIHDAQGQYAANFSEESVDWWPNYFVEVKAAPRHHSIPAKPRVRKAA